MPLSGSRKLTYPLYPIMFVVEFGLSLWLLVKGVEDQKFESKKT